MAYLVYLISLFLAALVGIQSYTFSNSYQEPDMGPCITAERVEGRCVLLQHCQEIYDIFKSSRTSQTRERLNKLRCNKQFDRYPRFCCITGQNTLEVEIPAPVQPIQPAQPVNPEQPVQPAQSVQPVQPAQLVQPVKPVQPEHPTRHVPTNKPTEETVPGGRLLSHPNIHLLPLEDCGLKFAEKIYGGNKTDFYEFPWAALLEYERNGQRSFECGGSLINHRYILTAAHCTNKGIIGRYRLVGVRLGEYNTITNPDCEKDLFGVPQICADPPKNFGIEEEIVHAEYKSSTRNQYHDIALLRLDADVEFTDFIRPICVPTSKETVLNNYLGKNLTATGWGRTQDEAKSTIKMRADLPTVSNVDCKKYYDKGDRRLASTQMCAGGVEGVDTCNGDSGGPLMSADVLDGTLHYHVTGIVSYGSTACHYGQPGVYTRVAAYSSWILDHLKP